MASLKEMIRDSRVKHRLFRKYRLVLWEENSAADMWAQMPYLQPADPKVHEIQGRLFRSSKVDHDTRKDMLDWLVEYGIEIEKGASIPSSKVARITADEACEFKMRWL